MPSPGRPNPLGDAAGGTVEPGWGGLRGDVAVGAHDRDRAGTEQCAQVPRGALHARVVSATQLRRGQSRDVQSTRCRTISVASQISRSERQTPSEHQADDEGCAQGDPDGARDPHGIRHVHECTFRGSRDPCLQQQRAPGLRSWSSIFCRQKARSDSGASSTCVRA